MIHLLYEILNESQANLVICMLITIPLSLLLGLINNKYLVLALSITTTYTMQSFLFSTEKHMLWLQQILVYLLLVISPRKIVGKVILIESFIYLALVQIRRMNIAYGINELDITGILMMQTFNYIGLGFNYQDGGEDPDKLSAPALHRRVVNRPDVLTYLGYVGFLPACLVGPIFQFSDFENYLNRKGDYQNIPNTIIPALKQFGIFLISTCIYLSTSRFQLDYLTTQQFADQNYFVKIFWVFAVIVHIEYKYIGAWSLGMVSMKISGLTYQIKKTQKGDIVHDFDRVQQTAIMKFYFEPSFKIKAETWNMSTQRALRRYIYERVYNDKLAKSPKQKKSLQSRAQFLTALTSAFWHGLYPGYFITFVHWIVALQVSQEVFKRRSLSKRFNDCWVKYKFMGWVENFLSNFCINYFGLFFHLMVLSKIWIFVNATYFIPFIVLFLSHILLVQLKLFSSTKKEKKGQQQHHPQVQNNHTQTHVKSL